MTKDEALRLALEALERSVATCLDPYSHEQVRSRPEHFINLTINAIKKTLAQPEQEPQIAINSEIVGYVAPQRTWVGLTDEEINVFEIWLDNEEEKIGWNPPPDIVKYLETKLKEKNT